MDRREAYYRQKKDSKTTLLTYALSGSLLISCMVLIPLGQEEVYIENYAVDALGILIITGLCVYYSMRVGFDVFDPLYLVTGIYGFLYFITPMYDIVSGHNTWFGYSLFPYGVKATWIALAGYLGLYFCYTSKVRIKYDRRLRLRFRDRDGRYKERDKITENTRIMVILGMYVVCFLANLYYLINSGYTSLLYIMTLGLLGGGGRTEEQLGSIGYLAMLSYCLPTIVLLYWKYSKSLLKTTILFIPMLMMQITRGFRFFIVQIAITFAAYFYISNGKRPRIVNMIGILLLLMIPVIIMTMFRNDIRGGHGLDLGQLSFAALSEAVEDAIWDNFRIYNNYYGVVGKVPSEYGYVYARQIIIGTLIMMIPRAIWPNKLSSAAGAELYQVIGQNLYKTGQALPGLGEFYYSCGPVGVVLFMSIYGLFLRYVWRRLVKNTRGELDLIAFSVLLGANLQVLIRGYTPSNFWYVVFCLIPIYVVKIVNTYLYDTKEAEERKLTAEWAVWERKLIKEREG